MALFICFISGRRQQHGMVLLLVYYLPAALSIFSQVHRSYENLAGGDWLKVNLHRLKSVSFGMINLILRFMVLCDNVIRIPVLKYPVISNYALWSFPCHLFTQMWWWLSRQITSWKLGITPFELANSLLDLCLISKSNGNCTFSTETSPLCNRLPSESRNPPAHWNV